jgi:hypothetical protein
MSIVKRLKTISLKFYIKIKQKSFSNRLRYLFFNNHSDCLVVVFSAFPSDNHPRYNYIKSLDSLASFDRLYILDDFGYKGSYYWFEYGDDYPMRLVDGLLSYMLSRKKYKKVFMLGSSKGGTSAIYYGLQFNATAVYSGANQYYIGKYLYVPERKDVFNAMVGADADETIWINRLDCMMKSQLSKYRNSQCVVNLLYSKDEHTYEDDIMGMIEDFKLFGIKYTEKIESFSDHGKVGNYFIPWINSQFQNL